MLITMANLLETSEIKRETVDNLIIDQYTTDVNPQNRSSILECPDCKEKFWRRILLLQHREVHKRNRKLLHSRNKKKQRKRRPSDGPTNSAAFNYGKDMEKLNCNTDVSDNEEVERTEHEKQASLKCKTQPREEMKDEFECSEYTLTPFTHNEVHIKKDSVEDDESKHNDKSELEKRKRHQVKDSTLLRFQCDICARTFSRKYTLTIHFRIHTGEKPFECKICFSRYMTKPNLIKHTITQHPEDNPYKCKQIFECDVCQKKFLYKWDVMQHRKTHTGEKRFKCAVCSNGYSNKIDFVQHLKSHTGNFVDDSKYPSFTCEVCNKTFTQKGKLTRHLRNHTDNKPFQCKICSLKFKTKSAVVKHSYRQHPEGHPYKGKTFECDACQKTFPFKSMLLNHKRIHTGERPFNCAVCQKGHWKKLDLVQHLKRHTGNKKDLIDDSEYSSFECEICSKTFKRKGVLNRHKRVHDRPFQCIVCSLKFKTKSVLVKHSYNQHSEDNPYDCKEDYPCDVCQKKFPYKSDMVYHRKKHTGDKHLESHSGNEREKDENLVLERCSAESASLQCEAPTKEEIKIEVKDEFECSEYTLQPFTYHGLHIENNGVEEYESKHKCNDVHEERKHQVVDQVREDVTDSESHDHYYVGEKLEKHKFNEPYLEVFDIKQDTDSENYTS